jgi:uncharacterized protein YecE (DUF72 family)
VTSPRPRIGLAGWSEAVSRQRTHFPTEGSGLTRYAATFNFVEVNVTFYRAVRESTFAGWAEQTPEDFRFSVKLNRSVTHAARLSVNARLEEALGPMRALGDKLAALLVQLPPSLTFDPAVAADFLGRLRAAYDGTVAWEPRHPDWDLHEAQLLLAAHGITRVTTDIPGPETPCAPSGAYVRLHGEPRRYRSPYSSDQLRSLADWIDASDGPDLIVFDNTAGPAGVSNARELQSLLAA